MHDDPIPLGYCQCGCGRETKRAVKSRASSGGPAKGEPFRFIHGHHRRKPGPDYEVAPTGCWLWIRTMRGDGYGSTSVDGKQRIAHRVYYERHVGPIPDGLELDHLCRVRNCVNPSHLEAVTHVENVMRGFSVPAIKARQSHCKRGHELAGDNVYRSPKGHRDCRACHRIDQREWKRRKRKREALTQPTDNAPSGAGRDIE